MLAALMDSRPLLPFIFLLRSLACVFLLFSQQLLKPRGVMKRPICFELVLILDLSLSAGMKAMANPILLSVLLLYFSFSFLCFFFYPLVFLPVRPLFFWVFLFLVLACVLFSGLSLSTPYLFPCLFFFVPVL
jgi:hypothetical protein